MTRDEILKLAGEAGFDTSLNDVYVWAGQDRVLNELTEFAKLVATAEREACAKVCENLVTPSRPIPSEPGRAWIAGTLDCATAIRARGNTE